MSSKAALLFLLPLLLSFADVANGTRCFEARDTGDGDCGKKSATRFYFDQNTERCQPMMYKGCAGNRNRFFTRAECEQHCLNAQGKAPTYEKKVCKNGVFAAVDGKGVTLSCASCPKGYSCEMSLCCPSTATVCSQSYDAGKFGTGGVMTPRFYYNSNYKSCMLFTYFGIGGNSNNFATYKDCHKFCM